jgi:hypothetical protein
MRAPVTSHVLLAGAMREVRHHLDIAQPALARRMRCDRSYVSQFENAHGLPGEQAWEMWLRAVAEAAGSKPRQPEWTAQLETKVAETKRLYAQACTDTATQRKRSFTAAQSVMKEDASVTNPVSSEVARSDTADLSPTVASRDVEEGDRVRRDAFLKLTAVTAAAVTGGSGAAEAQVHDEGIVPSITRTRSSVAPLDSSRASVVPELVEYFRAQLAGHYLADVCLGPRHLVPTVAAQCQLITDLAIQAPAGPRQQLLRVGAAYAALIGWLYQDAGDLAASAKWRDQTLDMAHRSQDRQLLCYALTNKAMLSVDAGDGPTVIDFTQAALMDTRLDPKMRLGALVQAAHGYSLIGDQDACDRSLDQAQELLGQTDDELPWGNACRRTPRYFDTHRATCYGRLGRAHEAAALWTNVLADIPASARRDRGVFSARYAMVLAQAHEPEPAVRAAATAVQLARATGSVRLRRELLAVAEHASKWRETAPGRALTEMLVSIEPGSS